MGSTNPILSKRGEGGPERGKKKKIQCATSENKGTHGKTSEGEKRGKEVKSERAENSNLVSVCGRKSKNKPRCEKEKKVRNLWSRKAYDTPRTVKSRRKKGEKWDRNGREEALLSRPGAGHGTWEREKNKGPNPSRFGNCRE